MRAQLFDYTGNVEMKLIAQADTEFVSGTLDATLPALEAMTGAGTVKVVTDPDFEVPEGALHRVYPDFGLYAVSSGRVENPAERARLKKELVRVNADLAKVEGKLANEQFLNQAPADVVEKERTKQQEFQRKKEGLEGTLAAIGD